MTKNPVSLLIQPIPKHFRENVLLPCAWTQKLKSTERPPNLCVWRLRTRCSRGWCSALEGPGLCWTAGCGIAQEWLRDFSVWQIKPFCLHLLISAEENTAMFLLWMGWVSEGRQVLQSDITCIKKMTKFKAKKKNSLSADLESGAAFWQPDLILIFIIKPQTEKILCNFGLDIFVSYH